MSSEPLDSESILDRLYAAPLADFVSLRNEAEKALKRQGHKNDAAKVKALRKPSVAAWTVNQLSFRAGDDLEALVEANRRLAEAHGQSTGDLAAAIENRKACLARLAERAGEIMADHGLKSSRDQLRRLNGTLEAATQPGASPPPGRLVEDLEPAGFGALAGLALAGSASSAEPTAPKHPRQEGQSSKESPVGTAEARPRQKRTSAAPRAEAPTAHPAKGAAAVTETDPEARRTAARVAAEGALRAEEERLERTERLLARAEADAGAAHRRVGRSRAKLEELEARLEKAKSAVQDASAEADGRERALADLRRDLADARSRVGKAREALDLALLR